MMFRQGETWWIGAEVSCKHSSGQSGAALFVQGRGSVRLVLVCDECGAVQGELGALDYRPRPALSPPVTGATEADLGPSPIAA
jgi:hypothetical protein